VPNGNRFRGDFALAHASKNARSIAAVERVEAHDYLAYQLRGVTKHEFLLRWIMTHAFRLLFGFICNRSSARALSLLFPQPVNRPTPGQCHHPAKWFSLLGRESFRLIQISMKSLKRCQPPLRCESLAK